MSYFVNSNTFDDHRAYQVAFPPYNGSIQIFLGGQLYLRSIISFFTPISGRDEVLSAMLLLVKLCMRDLLVLLLLTHRLICLEIFYPP